MEQIDLAFPLGRVGDIGHRPSKRARWQVAAGLGTMLFDSPESAYRWGWRNAPAGIGQPAFEFVEAFPRPIQTTCGAFSLVYRGRKPGNAPASFVVMDDKTLKEVVWKRA